MEGEGDETYFELDRRWRSACRALLGEEIGELGKYRAYLKKFVYPMHKKNSCLSGKSVFVSSEEFCESAKFVTHEESEAAAAALAGGFRPSIDQIKDLDSILQALGEMPCYTGSIVLGNSSHVAESNRCTNSHFVFSSTDVYDSKYVCHSSKVRYGECVFGSNASGESKFMIKGFRHHRSSRCMEVMHAEHSLECYFCGRIDGCQNCMFSFNQRSKMYIIGNLQLSKEKYLQLKAKLLEDIRNTLESRKNILSIVDILAGGAHAGKEKAEPLELLPAPESAEKSFAETARLLFGKEIGKLAQYRKWLFSHVPEPMKIKSDASNSLGQN